MVAVGKINDRERQKQLKVTLHARENLGFEYEPFHDLKRIPMT